jgi:hypothetical protein
MTMEASRWQKARTLAIIILFPAFVLFIAFLGSNKGVPPPRYVQVMACLLAIGVIYSHGTNIVLKVTLTENNELECITLLCRRLIPISKIRVIDVRPWMHYITVRARGLVYIAFYRNMPGALDAFASIAERNPSINLKE